MLRTLSQVVGALLRSTAPPITRRMSIDVFHRSICQPAHQPTYSSVCPVLSCRVLSFRSVCLAIDRSICLSASYPSIYPSTYRLSFVLAFRLYFHLASVRRPSVLILLGRLCLADSWGPTALPTRVPVVVASWGWTETPSKPWFVTRALTTAEDVTKRRTQGHRKTRCAFG